MRQRGFALITVIWVLVLLSIVSTSFSSLVRVETASASWLSEQTQSHAAVSAGIHRAIQGASIINAEQRWLPGQTRNMPWNDHQITILLQTESGKVDLNYAPHEILSGLFREVLGDDGNNALADAVIDWRDRDNTVLGQGAEALDYLNAGLNHVPANGPLASVDELSQVMGFDAEKVEQLRPYITVFSRRPKIDVNSASNIVLAALPGVGLDLANSFVAQRDQATPGQAPLDLQLLESAKQYLDANRTSSILTIQVEAISPDGHQHREQAVVRLQSHTGKYQLLAWDTLQAMPQE